MKTMLISLVMVTSATPSMTPQHDEYIAAKCPQGCYLIPSRQYENLVEEHERQSKVIRGLVERIEKERKWCQPERI